MKIAYFTDTYLPTINGISYAIRNWQKELEQRGHTATVVCPSPGASEDDVTFKSVRFPFYEGYQTAVLPPIKHDFSDYDVVHINGPFMAGIYGAYVARKYDLPLIATMHTPNEEYLEYISKSDIFQRIGAQLYRKYESYLMNKADLCLTPTAGIKEEIQERLDKDIKVLSNGVDTDFFRPVDASDFRNRHDIASDRVIGYTGRLGKEKRVDELIRIADDFDGEIIIGGDGPLRDHYEDLASDKDNVTFLGFLDRAALPELYSCLDILVFPSQVETEGLVALEANACGTPAVGADAKGLKSSIINGKNGYRYEPGDRDDLQQKIDRAYDNLDSLVEGSLENAADKSVSHSVEKMLAYYHYAKIQKSDRTRHRIYRRIVRPLRRLF